MCYLLSTIQVVIRLPKLKEYLYQVANTFCNPPENYQKDVQINARVGVFVQHLYTFLHAIRKNEALGFVTYELESLISVFCALTEFDYNQQQDAHECICNNLLNNFLDDFCVDFEKKFRFTHTILDPFVSKNDQDQNTVNYMNKSFIRQLIGGIKQSTLKGQNCGHSTQRTEQFMELMVNMPKPKIPTDSVPLSACIADHFQAEHMTDGEKWRCSECGDFVEAWKSEIITHSPNIMIIVLKRFQTVNQQGAAKDSTAVEIPLQNLDMSDYIADDGEHVYSCFAIVDHLGRTRGHGHYVSYINQGGKWFLFNDEKCYPFKIETETICTREGYILFYKKKDF